MKKQTKEQRLHPCNLPTTKSLKGKTIIWECERCGRKGLYKFFEHATSKIANDFCTGKIKRIKIEKMW